MRQDNLSLISAGPERGTNLDFSNMIAEKHYSLHSGGFQRWWDEYALATRGAGGSVSPVDEEVAHSAWVACRRRRHRDQLVMGLVFGCVIGTLVADRVLNRKSDS